MRYIESTAFLLRPAVLRPSRNAQFDSIKVKSGSKIVLSGYSWGLENVSYALDLIVTAIQS